MPSLNLLRGRTVSRPVRSQAVRPAAPQWKQAGLFGASAAIVAQAPPALAETVPDADVDAAIESVVGVVKNAGDLVKSSITTIDAGVKVLKQGYEVAAPVVESGVKAIAPVVAPVFKQAVTAATPYAQSSLTVLESAGKSIEASINSDAATAIVGGASKAITFATPIAAKVASFVASSEPETLGEYALGAVAFTYIAPAIFGLLTRGFAGEITAAQVLGELNDGAVLVDVRSEAEKDASGVPDLPSSVNNKLIDVELATIEDKRLRGNLRDAGSLENTITALQIASLRRINSGTKVVLLDRYGSTARAVAKELARKGFSQVYTITGGFDGRGGWVQSKLQIKPSATAMSAPAPKLPFGSRSTRSLPAPKSS